MCGVLSYAGLKRILHCADMRGGEADHPLFPKLHPFNSELLFIVK